MKKNKKHYTIRLFSPLYFAIICAVPVALWLAMYGASWLVLMIKGVI